MAEVAEDVKEGIREMVAVNLIPRTVWQIVYGGHTFPTINNIVTLRDEAQFFTLGEEKVKHLLTDTSPRTAVEDGDRHFPAVHAKRQCTRRLIGTQALAAIFKECILPSQLQQPTREAYYSAWRTVVTWGVAHEEVKALLPMSQDTLQATTQEMLMIGCSAGNIRNLDTTFCCVRPTKLTLRLLILTHPSQTFGCGRRLIHDDILALLIIRPLLPGRYCPITCDASKTATACTDTIRPWPCAWGISRVTAKQSLQSRACHRASCFLSACTIYT